MLQGIFALIGLAVVIYYAVKGLSSAWKHDDDLQAKARAWDEQNKK